MNIGWNFLRQRLTTTPAIARRLAPAVMILSACYVPPVHDVGCLEPPPQTGRAVARVGEIPITVERLENRIKAQGLGRHRYENVKALRDLVDDEVRFELLAAAAYDRGLWRDPDVIDAARRVMVRKLLQRDLEPVQFEGAVGESALRAYYDAHRDSYLQPEKRRFAQIQLAATSDGRALAQTLIERLKNKPDAQFMAAQAHYGQAGKDITRPAEFLTQDETSEAYGLTFATQVFANEPGHIVPTPVESTHGWHVVRVLARREALARDFEDIRDQIREKLLQGQRTAQFQKYIEELRVTYPVAIYADVMQSVLAQWAGKNP